jgi:hypothetical protein
MGVRKPIYLALWEAQQIPILEDTLSSKKDLHDSESQISVHYSTAGKLGKPY